MTWQDRTPQERRELRERRSKRRERRTGHVTALWSAKQYRARGAADVAAVTWDAARKRINQIKDGPVRDAEWARLTTLLERFVGDGQSSTHSHSRGATGSAAGSTRRRAHAREAQPDSGH